MAKNGLGARKGDCAIVFFRQGREAAAGALWAGGVCLGVLALAASAVMGLAVLFPPPAAAPEPRDGGDVPVAVSGPLVMEVTGYSQSPEEGTADGITVSLLPVARGMAAADPAVLPAGTVILVPGYGYALVGDVGSAIKGRRLDLFFPTRDEAFAWGRRVVAVRVLSYPGARLAEADGHGR